MYIYIHLFDHMYHPRFSTEENWRQKDTPVHQSRRPKIMHPGGDTGDTGRVVL